MCVDHLGNGPRYDCSFVWTEHIYLCFKKPAVLSARASFSGLSGHLFYFYFLFLARFSFLLWRFVSNLSGIYTRQDSSIRQITSSSAFTSLRSSNVPPDFRDAVRRDWAAPFIVTSTFRRTYGSVGPDVGVSAIISGYRPCVLSLMGWGGESRR